MKKSFLCALFFFVFMPFSLRAELSIDITGAHSEPMATGLPVFSAGGEQAKEMAEKISQVIESDLESSGLFRILDPLAYLQTFKGIEDAPVFVDWQAIKAEALIQGHIDYLSEKQIRVSVRLWDVYAAQELYSATLEIDNKGWRRAAHMIADAVYKRITGEEGYFDTRIVYIAETGTPLNRIKRLAIMDQDGENHQFLTDGLNLVLTPRFSPNMQQITYLSFYKDTPRGYLFDIETGKQQVVGDFPGMTFAPRFSPDGHKLIMSMAENGNTDIFELDLDTRAVKQLTNSAAIETSPSYSPDGKKIVFNSDRSGAQQLYVMDSNGKNVKRISFGNGRYATPVWSPRGDYIAFTKIAGGQFYIGVMHPDGSGERLLASGYLVEGPTWSPNGRVLMYFRQDKGTARKNAPVKLYTIDISGYNERMVVTPAEASDPAWSPLLPQ